jgi:dTDP-4-dehydrorhamnose reductase
MKKKILITGGEGMLGTACTAIFSQHHEVRSCGRATLDVTKKKDFLPYISWRPDVVLHTAAIVNADYCEEHPDEARKVQIGGTENVIAFCKETGARLFYPQSFLIFDGKENPITEKTKPNPLSVYGRMKLEAEELIRRELPLSLIVRMGGFFGGEEKDKNFVGKFTRHLKKCLDEGVRSIDVGDRVWQPTYTEDLALNSLVLIEKDKGGVYNMASRGHASFFEIAEEMISIFGIGDHIAIQKIDASTIQEKAVRPMVAVMENTRLRAEGLNGMRPWQEALQEYLSRPYFQKMFPPFQNS